jgi:2-iminobutanoate/2-iminopropanoate deaminase
MMESIVIASEKTLPPVGPHSQAMRRGNILAIGGQVGTVPRSGIVCDGIHEQLRQAMTNIQELLKEADVSFADVILLHVYLTEEGHFREMNNVLSEFLIEPFPARTTVYTQLSPGMLVQIDALAVIE